MAAVHDQIGRFPVQQMNGSQCAGERSPHESEVSLLAEQMFRQIMIPFFLSSGSQTAGTDCGSRRSRSLLFDRAKPW